MSNPYDAVHHVTIQVADIGKSIAWYETSFNCSTVLRTPTHAVIEFANVLLVLVLPSQEPPHLAFARSDADRFGELRPRVEGIKSTFVADPTGNVIELVASGVPVKGDAMGERSD